MDEALALVLALALDAQRKCFSREATYSWFAAMGGSIHFELKLEYKLFISTNHLSRMADNTVFASGRVKIIRLADSLEDGK